MAPRPVIRRLVELDDFPEGDGRLAVSAGAPVVEPAATGVLFADLEDVLAGHGLWERLSDGSFVWHDPADFVAASDLAATNATVATVASDLSDTAGDLAAHETATVAVHGIADTAEVELTTRKGAADGYASLDGGGHVPSDQLPTLTFTAVTAAASQAAMLASAPTEATFCHRTDINEWFLWVGGDPTQLTNWTQVVPPPGVSSVNGNPGPAVNLTAADVGADATGAAAAAQAAAEAASDPAGTAAAAVAAIPSAAAAATASLRKLGVGATDAAAGNDARLSDSRTPLAHAASHLGGADDLLSTLDVHYDPLGAKQRREIACRGAGYYNDNGIGIPNNNSAAFISGTLYASLVGFKKGDVATNLSIVTGAALGTVSLIKLGIFKTDGTLLAATADFHAALAVSSTITVPLTAPYNFTADSPVYLACLIVHTGSPTLGIFLASSGVPNNVKVGAGAPYYASELGLSDLPSPAVFAAGVPVIGGNAVVPWIGVS